MDAAWSPCCPGLGDPLRGAAFVAWKLSFDHRAAVCPAPRALPSSPLSHLELPPGGPRLAGMGRWDGRGDGEGGDSTGLGLGALGAEEPGVMPEGGTRGDPETKQLWSLCRGWLVLGYHPWPAVPVLPLALALPLDFPRVHLHQAVAVWDVDGAGGSGSGRGWRCHRVPSPRRAATPRAAMPLGADRTFRGQRWWRHLNNSLLAT